MRAWIPLIALGLSLPFLGATCPQPDTGGTDGGSRQASLLKFSSGEELRAFLADQATARTNAGGTGSLGCAAASPSFNTVGDMALSPGAADAESGTGTDTRGYSTTNIQEAGVDEGDLVKNDAETIFWLTGSKVHIVQAAPLEALGEVAVLELPGAGDSLYLQGDTLLALSGQGSIWFMGGGWGGGWAEPAMGAATATAQAMPMIGGPWADGAQTTVSIYNVATPSTPSLVKAITFEGSLVSSRLVDGKLHLVLMTMPQVQGGGDIPVAEVTLEQWIPDMRVAGPDGGVISSGDVVAWDNVFRPAEPNGYAMTIVATLDVNAPETPIATTAVAANVGTIYASTEALYLTDTQYSWGTGASHEDTIIHKLALTDTGTDYVASGVVSGRPLNQYSLGEYQDRLRIATSTTNWDTGVTSSSVYVLEALDEVLRPVGKIEGIAPGETIYAARFIGPRGFLVTFRRVDPLFTMDLSEPANPRIVGELKVPGYSDHIQLLDENHLLTIGRDAQDVGDFAWVQGVQLSLFDITDMTNPQLVTLQNGTEAKVVIGGRGTYSEANHNPKAFNYYADAQALAFPIDVYDGDTVGAEYGLHGFTGLYVYRVTVENGFQFLGRIASARGSLGNGCFEGYYGATRGVFIGNNVYSVTDAGVKVAAIDTAGTVLDTAEFSAGGSAPMVNCLWPTPNLAIPASVDLR